MYCPARSGYPLVPHDNPPFQILACREDTARVGSIQDFSSCKFFGNGTGQIMKPHARVDFSHVRQADTREVSRWHWFSLMGSAKFRRFAGKLG